MIFSIPVAVTDQNAIKQFGVGHFFQSINTKNEDGLKSTVAAFIDSFLGKSDASPSDVVTFMKKIYKDDITNMNWRLNNDFKIDKKQKKMSTKSDLRVLLGVDGEAEFSRKMDKIAKQQRELKDQFKLANSELGASASSYDKAKVSAESLTKQIEVQKNKVAEIEAAYEKARTEQGELSKTTIDLKHDYDTAQTVLNNLKNKLEETNKTIAEQESRLNKAGDALQKYSDRMGKIGDGMTDVGKSLTKNVSVPILTAGVTAAKSAVDFESAFAGVKKTVDATDEEFAQMSKTTLDMSTKLATSAEEIARVEEVAGQLGIAKGDIVNFSEVMIKLGMSTDLSAEEAASALSKIANITNMPSEKYP